MKITIIGAGWVGVVNGVCFAELGNSVTCVDKDQKKIRSLKKNTSPFYEPGLEELLTRNQKEGRLFFTKEPEKAIKEAEVVINAVGTPPHKDGRCDLSSVIEAAKLIGKYINGYKVVINRSTVPAGTAAKVKKIIMETSQNHFSFDVVSNPEFLREGQAIYDFLNPDRIIVGVDTEKARKIMEQLYFPIARTGRPIIFTNPKAAELIKYAANAFLSTKISFINEIANYCGKIGVDVQEVERGVGSDSRIGGRFLHAGIGFGGSCLPKDIDALIEHAKEDGYEFQILSAVREVNRKQRFTVIKKLKSVYPFLKNKKIAIWGISFKPKTDDIRSAPSLDIISELLRLEAKVSVFDPEALKNLEKFFNKKQIFYGHNPYQILKNSDALILLTEWDEFRNPDFERMKKLMKEVVIIDGRNVYDPKTIEPLGFKYLGIGR